MKSALKGRLVVVKLLCCNGADFNTKTNVIDLVRFRLFDIMQLIYTSCVQDGRDALHYAERENHLILAQFLRTWAEQVMIRIEWMEIPTFNAPPFIQFCMISKGCVYGVKRLFRLYILSSEVGPDHFRPSGYRITLCQLFCEQWVYGCEERGRGLRNHQERRSRFRRSEHTPETHQLHL